MKMDNALKQQLIGQLSLPWGQVELKCDDFRVSLHVRQEKSLKYVVAVWVNGKMQKEWFDPEKQRPETKFFRIVEKAIYSTAKKSEYIKAFGKRRAEKDLGINRKIRYCIPVFNTANSAISHILKVSEKVEVLQVGQYE